MSRLLIAFIFFIATGCNLSTQHQTQLLTGIWEVHITLGDSLLPLVKQEEKLVNEDQILEDIEKELELSEEIGSQPDSGLGKGLKDLVTGLSKMAEGLSQMAEGLAKTLPNLITENIKFTAELKKDGSVRMISTNDSFDINLKENELLWTVEEDQFVLKSNTEEHRFVIDKQVDGFDLKGQKVNIHLRKPKNNEE